MRNPELLYELVQIGALLQANSGSFSGLYGTTVQEGVHRFLELRLIHFIASDSHNIRSITPKLSGALEKAEEILGKKEAYHLVEGNPLAVINNEEIPYLPEPINPSVNKKSLKMKIPKIFKHR